MNNNSTRKILAGKIKEERQKRQWSQAKLAELVNVNSTSTIGNWESGTAAPDYEKLCFLADLFGVSADYLLGRASVSEPSAQDTEVTEDEKMILFQYNCCEEIGQGAIDSCIAYHYNRCTAEPEGVKSRLKNRAPTSEIQKIFLQEGKDEDYEKMQSQIPYLRTLKKNSHKSYMEITKYLWDIGHGDEICLAFVMDLFGRGLNKRVPSRQLYGEIESFLKGDYVVVANARPKGMRPL